MAKKEVRLSVPLPDEVHTRFKVQCALARRPMVEVAAELIEKWIQGRERRRGR